MVTCIVSKCTHIAGVGVVSLPEAKVSTASKKLKSSWTNGFGIGDRGRIARRNMSAVRPTTTTERPFRRASLPKVRSAREKLVAPSRGQQNASANAIAVRQPSIIINGGRLCSGEGDRIITELFASLLFWL